MKNAFAMLVIFVCLCIVGKLDYADEVMTENANLRARLQTEHTQCAARRTGA